jgi:lipopolysaccharide cholinephosphotransferase
MEKKPLTLDEKREIQLKMLDEVDTFCRNNGIRYSLASGTLLGAIRHKGFIPWDDDMDIVMPEPDFLRFYDSFKSDNVRCIDIRNEKYFHFPWAKLCDTHTYSAAGKKIKGHGVDIDLYIIHGLPHDDKAIEDFYKKANKICSTRLFLVKWRKRIVRRFPVHTIPFYSMVSKKYRDLSFSNSYEGTKKYIFHSDRMDWAHTYDYDLFENTVNVTFNGHTYMAIASWEKYLIQRYGDYMQLPPEDQRHPVHGGVFYRK